MDASSGVCVFSVSILSDICHLEPVREEDWTHIEFDIKNSGFCDDMWINSDSDCYI